MQHGDAATGIEYDFHEARSPVSLRAGSDQLDQPRAASISVAFRPAFTSSSSTSFGFIARLRASSSRLRSASVSVEAGLSQRAQVRRTRVLARFRARGCQRAAPPANSAPPATLSARSCAETAERSVKCGEPRCAIRLEETFDRRAAKQHATARCRRDAGDDVDQRGLAGAVGTDETMISPSSSRNDTSSSA